jgi:magnesium transporter
VTPPKRDEERPIAALLAPDILALLDESPSSIATELEEMHPADLATVAEAMPRDRVPDLLRALPAERAAELLSYLDEELQTEVLETMSPRQAADIVVEMTPDDRVDALEELDDEQAQEIIDELPEEERAETEQLRAYEPDTAGGLMTTEFVSVPQDISAEDALAAVRTAARGERHEAMYAIYITDAAGRLAGVLSLRELLAAPEGARLGDVAWSEVQTVLPTADREQVSRMVQDYDLVAVPVVNTLGRILGVVTVDDAFDAAQEEATEDAQKFGGMEALDEPYTQISFVNMMKKRAGWLSVIMISEMLTTSVLSHYESELKAATVLMLFVPLVMSSGGNSGSQSTSLIIRAMALDELRLKDWWRVAAREIPTGIVLGSILGLIGFGRIILWQKLGWHDFNPHYMLVATTVACALVGIVTFGTLMGAMLPFAMRRLGADPASASAPFVATFVDVTGLAIYFMVAFAILHGTLL